MGKILTQAQKTFTDLYDSYVLNLSSDIVAVPCDQDGKATEDCEIKIIYDASVGTQPVGIQACQKISATPTGVVCNTSTIGEIVITIDSGTELADDYEVGFTFTTSNSNAFTFTRYITFIKVKQGSNGENARSFQIKSEQGDTFDEGVESITMDAVAFDGFTQITGKSYAWHYFVSGSGWTPVLDMAEDKGEGAVHNGFTGSSLTVNKTDPWANSVFRCIITYNDDSTDEDYYQLKTAYHNYESVVKFFGGTNTIDSAEPFVIAYVDLYKDYQQEESIKADYYNYHPDSKKTTNGININFDKVDSIYNTDGNLMYAIYKDETVAPPVNFTSYTITTGVSPSLAGTVTGGGVHEYGANIKLTATAASGYKFDGWTDGVKDNPRTITVTESATYAASFAVYTADKYTITAKSYNANYGSAYVNGLANSSGTYDAGSVVTLSAAANIGYVFEDWYENEVAKNWPQSINIAVNSNRTFKAKFRPTNSGADIINIISEGESKSIQVYKDSITYLSFQPTESGSYTFYSNENMILHGYVYDSSRQTLLRSDTGDASDTNFSITYSFTGGEDYYLGAKLGADYEYTSASINVGVNKNTTTTGYTVSLNMGTGGYSVSGAGTYNEGDAVTVTATAKNGYGFWYWQAANGAAQSFDNPYTFTINSSTTLTAIFFEDITSYTITAQSSDDTRGYVTGGGTYEVNAQIPLKAIAYEGYKFTHWTDGIFTAERTVTVTEDKTYTANFTVDTGNTLTAIIKSDTAAGVDQYYISSNQDITGNLGNSVEFQMNDSRLTNNTFYYIAQAGDNREIAGIDIITGSIVNSWSAADLVGSSLDSDGIYLDPSKKKLIYRFTISDIMLGKTYEFNIQFTNASSGGGDGGSDPIIIEDVVTSVVIPTKQTKVYLKFEPNHSGSYTFTSLDQVDLDPDGYICDSNKTEIDGCSDRTTSAGFSITYDNFIAHNIYYLAAELWNNPGTLKVKVSYNGSSSGGDDTTNYTLTLNVDPVGSGTATGAGSYSPGSTASIKATANNSSNYEFVGWYENGNLVYEAYTINIIMSRDRTLVAKFKEVSDSGSDVGTITEGVVTPVEVAQCVNDGGDRAELSDFALVKFVPTSSGKYQFEATGGTDADTYGRLYDYTQSSILAKADGGGSGEHFLFTHDCNAGTTYYLAVKFYFSSTTRGTVNLLVTRVSSGGGNEPTYAEDTILDGVLYIGTNTTSIASNAYFEHAQSANIMKVVIPYGVVSIGTQAFRDCSNLTTVYIPVTVTEIAMYAFFNTNVTDIYYTGTSAQWNAINFSSGGYGNEILHSATKHYNYISTYAAEPMMFAATPMTLALDDNEAIAYADNDTDKKRAKYKAALCQYSSANKKWEIINSEDNYIYQNSLYSDVTSNVVVVAKEDVSSYKSIDVTIYKKVLDNSNQIVFDNDLIISNNSFTVFDLNDPVLGNSAPLDPKEGQLWLDTSQDNAYVLYIYQDGKWAYFNQQLGKTIYTTQPETYSVGDIWILSESDGEKYSYGKGAMLTATETVTVKGGFSITHWTDATPGTTNAIKNITESFSWDNDGVNIAQKITHQDGHVTSPFYVQITSTKMGFHSVANGEDDEVVHIGNSSATILNATFEGDKGTKFENDADFYNQVNILHKKDGKESGFAFQTEADGSFSLILVGR